MQCKISDLANFLVREMLPNYSLLILFPSTRSLVDHFFTSGILVHAILFLLKNHFNLGNIQGPSFIGNWDKDGQLRLMKIVIRQAVWSESANWESVRFSENDTAFW